MTLSTLEVLSYVYSLQIGVSLLVKIFWRYLVTSNSYIFSSTSSIPPVRPSITPNVPFSYLTKDSFSGKEKTSSSDKTEKLNVASFTTNPESWYSSKKEKSISANVPPADWR